jgi:hypothetical protein
MTISNNALAPNRKPSVSVFGRTGMAVRVLFVVRRKGAL